ncbi:MAG: hypothetical protein ACLPTJ_09265 [Solirubrobacteraceae bacterium]
MPAADPATTACRLGVATTASEQAALDTARGRSAARLLALLRQDRDHGVTLAAIRERGIEAPAQAIYRLQLAGYAINRVPAAGDGRKSVAYRLRGGPYEKADPEHESLRRTFG